MRVRIKQQMTVPLELHPGDELVVQRMTPGLDSLLKAGQINGDRLVELVDEGDEVATVDAIGETATKPRGTRGRSTPVPA